MPTADAAVKGAPGLNRGARDMQLAIAAVAAERFEPGRRREMRLIHCRGIRKIYGFNGRIMGSI